MVFFLSIFALIHLLGVKAEAADPVRLAYSEKLGMTLFAYPDGSGDWCRARLAVSILLKQGSPLLSQGIDGELPKFGALFAEKCPAAASASVALYKASDQSLIGKSFSIAKADNWSRPHDGQAGQPPAGAPTSQEAPPEMAQCDHSPVAAAYFIASCQVRGLDLRRQSEGLDAARSRQVEASKGLLCTAQSMTKVNDLALQAALRIVNSGVISPLMDFNDGLQVECRKASADLLK